jgi:hypothetical protein
MDSGASGVTASCRTLVAVAGCGIASTVTGTAVWLAAGGAAPAADVGLGIEPLFTEAEAGVPLGIGAVPECWPSGSLTVLGDVQDRTTASPKSASSQGRVAA